MTINDIVVEDATRKVLKRLAGDPIVLDPVLKLAEHDTSLSCLRFVEPYGDTVFNGLQCAPLVVELERMANQKALIDIGIDPMRPERSVYYKAEKELLERRGYPVTRNPQP